jgi:hypothetical protein
VARENIKDSGLTNVTCDVSDLLKQVDTNYAPYGVICANIVADIIIRMTPDVGRLMDEHSVILASGIIVERSEDVIACFEQNGFYIAERVEDILNSVPNLKSVYDPANYLQVGETAEKTLSLFHHRTDYFHIKDVVSQTGELVPAGHGDGKIEDLVAKITDDKVLSIEPHLAVFSGYENFDKTQMKHKFHFTSCEEAFDTAVNALKEIIIKVGYKPVDGGYEKL